MRRKQQTRAQVTLEVLVLLAVITVACYLIGSYVHRASNGRIYALTQQLEVDPYDENAIENISYVESSWVNQIITPIEEKDEETGDTVVVSYDVNVVEEITSTNKTRQVVVPLK